MDRIFDRFTIHKGFEELYSDSDNLLEFIKYVYQDVLQLTPLRQIVVHNLAWNVSVDFLADWEDVIPQKMWLT